MARLKVLSYNAPFTGAFFRSIFCRNNSEATQGTVDMLEIVRQKTEARGGKFVLIFLPTLEECLAGHLAVDVSGIYYLDIRKYFPADKKELMKLRFLEDHHWNARGHEVAAKAIVNELVRIGAVDGRYLRR